MRGHGADVKCVHWHPTKSLVVSGSKDNQQPIKLWDPKSGQALSTLHAHKSTVMDLKWNDNGNWLITASRDHLLKLFDLRNLKEDMQTFRGHKKEASAVCWNPVHEGLFVSGGSDGQILFWNVGTDKEIGGIEAAHESIVWTLAWHPCGHILCSGSNDHTVKFWTRNRPGDQMRDKYNLNTLPASLAGLEDYEMDEHTVIPGMDIKYNDEEYNEEQIPDMLQPPPQEEITSNNENAEAADIGIIPGLDLEAPAKKPFIKPIPKNFQEQWNVESKTDKPHGRSNEPFDILKHAQAVILSVMERMPGVLRVDESRPNKVIIFGKEVDVKPGTRLFKAIMDGNEALYNYLNSGDIEEMNESSSYDDNSNGNSNQDSATSFGNDRHDGDDFEPQAKRFRTEDFDNNYDNENSNSGGGIPSLLNINVPPPANANFPDQTAQKSPTVWDNNSGFNNNSNNGAFNSNANNQKPTQRTREGRRQGSRWSSKR
jgi:polyadenylation factor subunit 2